MPSENALGKNNQQERLRLIGWIVGFVDGEGCFTISLHKNSTTSFGWQIMPEFVLTQGEKSLPALKKVKDYFRCGRLVINRRYDNHRENLYRYCVKSQKELREIIIPFFKKNKLMTSKRGDFEKFSSVLTLMENKKHLTIKGIRKILSIIEGMNTRKKRQLILESSETIR
jgi:hypothetical protein